MNKSDFEELTSDIKAELVANPDAAFGILGDTPLSHDLIGFFRSIDAGDRLVGVFTTRLQGGAEAHPLYPIESLRASPPDVLVVGADTEKEDLLEEAVQFLGPSTRILLAGYGHFTFRDELFETMRQEVLVPSLANGYPHTLVHLYQCLCNASRLGLDGVVAEFGMFKGGTTMLLARLIEELGESWPVIGFDTFDGFPPRRSPLDMYDHPGCVFRDEASVRRYFSAANVEIVSGDIVNTAERLKGEKVVLAFLDTDNYSSASSALDVIQENVVVGGAIVFDHFTGRNRFRYTLGERIAGKRLLHDARFFHLHDTGVFLRQC